MKKVFYSLAFFFFSHLSVLAMDLPPQKVDEISPLIQNSSSNLEKRMLQFIGQLWDQVSSMCHPMPDEPELLFLYRVGTRLLDKEMKFLFKEKRAPYYKDLPLLIEYLIGLNQDILKNKWKIRLTACEQALKDLLENKSDPKTSELTRKILEDKSPNKAEAIGSYYALFEHILSKNGY